jgi:two-component system, cell cycle sensor histidine kinase and response regulator CckA
MDAAEKVLVVDDEPQVLVALEDLLAEGFMIFKAGSAEQARAIVSKEKDIAVVVTDQRMPRGTGDELLASLEESCDACAIMLTGYADLSAVVRAVNEGRLFAYVTKPWDPSDLRVKVTNAANHFRLARQLQHEQRLLHDLMNNSPDGIYFKGADGCFQRVNEAFAQIAGVARADDMIGQSHSQVFAERAPANDWIEADARILRARSPEVDVVRQYPSTSGLRWISETIAPILGATGVPIGLVGVARDVTERIRVQDELRGSERRFREQSELLNSILESMAEGVVVADAQGRLVFFNQHAERMFGELARPHSVEAWANEYGFYKADGRTPLDPGDDPLVRAVRDRVPSQAEIVVKNSLRSGRLLVVSAAPLAGAAGPMGGVALLRDVTEQRVLEQRLSQSEKMEAIGRLAGGVAHDFNNLLGVIQGYGELVLQSVREADPIRQDVTEMLKTTERAATLTRRLLEFSRQRLTQRVPLSLTVVLQGMVDMMRRVIGERVELVTELALELGLTSADPGQIEQVALNLVINARDAMLEGGRLTVRTYHPSTEECAAASLDAGEYIGLSISDTGVGIDPETLQRMFEPFFTTKPIGGGTGLGLSTVYGIVSQSQGHIRVESEVGRGTQFRIYLPRIYDKEATRAEGEPQQSGGGALATILLVEDDVALRPVIARVLRKHGHRVLEAESAERALRLAEEEKVAIDLLLTDVVMPGRSGLELAKELRARGFNLRVLYVSGYGKDLLTTDDLEPGQVACLEKPFTPTLLLRSVAALLAQRRVAQP